MRVWVRRCDLSAIALPDSAGLDLLPKIAITKPPYRLEGLALNCAVPARITGISVLIWRHPWLGDPGFELHTAARDTQAVRAKIMLYYKGQLYHVNWRVRKMFS